MALCVCVLHARNEQILPRDGALLCKLGKVHGARHNVSLFCFNFWVAVPPCNTYVRTWVCRLLVLYYDCYLNVSSGLPALGARKAVLAEDVQERI